MRPLRWLKITERIEYKLLSLTGVPTKFLQPTNITSSQFSLLAALALHLWSHLLVHLHRLQYASPRVWSQLPASIRQPRTNLSNSDLPSPMSGSSFISSINSPVSPLIYRSFFQGLKLSFSANSSHRSLPFLLPGWLHGFPGLLTDTSEHIRYFTFYFFFHFLVFGSLT